MSGRERLPTRRSSETFAFTCDGQGFLATIPRFDDGRLAEVFISDSRAGSHLDHLARDAAILASIAFQYGAPADVVRHALQRDQVGRAISPLGIALDILAGAGT